jgi:hypothetical protein
MPGTRTGARWGAGFDGNDDEQAARLLQEALGLGFDNTAEAESLRYVRVVNAAPLVGAEALLPQLQYHPSFSGFGPGELN